MTYEMKNIQEIENYLNQKLQPVNPDPGFISRLNEQIKIHPPQVAGIRSAVKVYLLLVFGCVTGLLIFWMIRQFIGIKRHPA